MIEVSVIIINYNTFELTCKCIQTIIDHTKGVNYEIILLDNASNVTEPHLFKEIFPCIILIESHKNLGFSKGNNTASKLAAGNTILFLNSDTELIEDSISHCYKYLNDHKEIGLITCKLINPDGSIQHQCRKFDTISLLLTEFLRLHKFWPKEKRANRLLNGYFDHEIDMFPDRIWGTFFMFKKNVINYLPYQKWSDDLFMYGEDNEWCYQLKKYTNYRVFYYSKTKIIHKLGGSNFGDNKKKVIFNNQKIVMSQYYGAFKTKIYFFLLNLIERIGL